MSADARFILNTPVGADFTDIYFRIEYDNGIVHHAMPTTMFAIKPEDEGKRTDPVLRVNNRFGKSEALQSLLDELWREGYRPKDIGTAGHLAATQAHLNDFRAIVSKTLDVKLP